MVEHHSYTRKGSGVDLRERMQAVEIPTLPEVAARLVALCKDEQANYRDFAELLELDPGLAARLLRVANSAYYGLRQKTTNVEQAISLLGLKYVKSIALGFHLAETLSDCPIDKAVMRRFWQQSVLRGLTARQVARRYVPGRQEEAFLVGLLLDCGVVLLGQVLGEDYLALWKQSGGANRNLWTIERKLYGADHMTAMKLIAEAWKLPELLTDPITHHHYRPAMTAKAGVGRELRHIGYFVGALPLSDPDKLDDEVLSLRDYGGKVFGLGEQELLDTLEMAKEEYGGVSLLFNDMLTDKVNVPQLLSQAKALLGNIAVEANRQISELEVEVARLQNCCATLSQSIVNNLQQAERDNLTGLKSRGFLERYLAAAGDLVQQGKGTLTVMFIDVDDFKHINTKYGHAMGDEVLKMLADLLRDYFDESVCIARYGGDEMIVALMGLALKQAVTLVTGLLRRVRRLEIFPDQEGAGQPHMSCSIGVVFVETGAAAEETRRLIVLADEQMYEAKHEHKNGFRLKVLLAESREEEEAKAAAGAGG